MAGDPSSSQVDRMRPDYDDALLAALRDGDERVFADLAERWSGVMLRVAPAHVDGRAVAEEVVQDAWLTVIRGIDRFERRSALRTWVLGIVVNLARSRARAERRAIPVALEYGECAVGPSRFPAVRCGKLAGPLGAWPRAVGCAGGRIARRRGARGVARRDRGPAPGAAGGPGLRDLEGVGTVETCNALGLSETNQRVLLHRARSRVRNALEHYFDATEPT